MLAPPPRPRPRLALCAVALLLTVPLAGCTTPERPPGDGTTPGNNTSTSSIWPTHVPDANGTRMLELVREQVYVNDDANQVRYRIPGTQGHQDAVPILEAMLADANLTTTREAWTQPLTQLGEVDLTNLYGARDGTNPSQGEIWLAAHWDSRAWADAYQEACTGDPVEGANDGAAAVAAVIHAAEQLPRLNHTLRVALFDAEDQGGCPDDSSPYRGWVQGSYHAATLRSDNGTLDQMRALILVDMPGDENLVVPREGYSESEAGRLTEIAFAMAERVDAPAFQNRPGPSILDDHKPFLDKGVSAVDLIHLDEDECRAFFPCTHHTLNDTVENLSPASMEQVARVVMGTVLAIDQGALDRGT